MQIIEQFTAGKAGDAKLNEDRVVVTKDFIAVLDGVTSRAGGVLDGRSTGRFAADVIGDAIAELPADVDAKTAVGILSKALKDRSEAAAASEGHGFPDLWSRPAAALLIYSNHRHEIWRAGDSTFAFGSTVNMVQSMREKMYADLRHVYLHSRLANGESEADFAANDPSWEILTPLIGAFKVFANHDSEQGYGVLNGGDVPPRHLEIFKVDTPAEIIFASDGYTDVLPTLADTENKLQEILKADPLMYKLRPQPKGTKKGHQSFDDRSYIRFTTG